MAQVQFTITDEAAAYLRWYARNILFEKGDTANAAARYLMMKQLEQIRRENRKDDPSPEDLAVSATAGETDNTEKS